jgi:hypothetical protein
LIKRGRDKMGGQDIRHEFVMYYVCLVVVWVLLSLLMANAQVASEQDFNSSNYTGWVTNNSSFEEMQKSSFMNTGNFFSNLMQFHMNVWYIDFLILTIGVVFAAYVGITLPLPGG